MKQMLTLSQLSEFRNVFDVFSSFGNDYIFCRISSAAGFANSKHGPVRVDGMIWILCRKGSLKVDINLDHCEMTENSSLVAPPGSIFEVRERPAAEIDAYMLIVSPQFMRDTNIDPNVLSAMPLSESLGRQMVMDLSRQESDLLCHYFELIHHNTTYNHDDLYVRSISRCLISAMCYQGMQFATRRIKPDEHKRPRTRRSSYVNEFMQLVHNHHLTERAVAFYAGKLFISPKYLSLIVKEATGRSAAEWIDEFVILEAKNRLRFSGKNIQQVAYELNFPNQSSFGKYFKHLTGMSPSEYQRS